MAAKVRQRERTRGGTKKKTTPKSETKESQRAIATDRLLAINDLSSEADNRYPEYDEEHEYDITDGIADGWLEDEPDGAHPIDDISESPASAESNRRCIIRFIDKDGLQYDLSPRHYNLQVSMDAGQAGDEVLIREERHARLANVLIEHQKDALAAETPRDAYLALVYMKQGDFNSTIATEHEDDGSSTWLSRTGHEMIACQWGTVPQQFFFWAPRPAFFDKALVFEELLDVALARFHYLASNKQDPEARKRLDEFDDKHIPSYSDFLDNKLPNSTSSEFVPLLHKEKAYLARRALVADSKKWSEVKAENSPIKNLPPIAISVVSDLRFRIQILRKSYDRWHEDELRSDLALARATKGRGMELLQFAIAGWEPQFGETWYQP